MSDVTITKEDVGVGFSFIYNETVITVLSIVKDLAWVSLNNGGRTAKMKTSLDLIVSYINNGDFKEIAPKSKFGLLI